MSSLSRLLCVCPFLRLSIQGRASTWTGSGGGGFLPPRLFLPSHPLAATCSLHPPFPASIRLFFLDSPPPRLAACKHLGPASRPPSSHGLTPSEPDVREVCVCGGCLDQRGRVQFRLQRSGAGLRSIRGPCLCRALASLWCCHSRVHRFTRGSNSVYRDHLWSDLASRLRTCLQWSQWLGGGGLWMCFVQTGLI